MGEATAIPFSLSLHTHSSYQGGRIWLRGREGAEATTEEEEEEEEEQQQQQQQRLLLPRVPTASRRRKRRRRRERARGVRERRR